MLFITESEFKSIVNNIFGPQIKYYYYSNGLKSHILRANAEVVDFTFEQLTRLSSSLGTDKIEILYHNDYDGYVELEIIIKDE